MAKNNLIKTHEKKIQSRIWFFSLKESENNIQLALDKLKHSSAHEVYYIKHDKDVVIVDDVGNKKPKDIHYHFCIHYSCPTKISTIQNIFNIDDEHINLIRKAKNWRGSCRYLTHLDDPEKYQYKMEDVVILKGSRESYMNIILDRVKERVSESDLIEFFCDFEHRTYEEQYLCIMNNIEDYKTQNRLIKELKESYNNYIDKRRYEMKNKKVEVIVIEGKPGSGKSTFAHQLCISNKLSFCVSSSANDVLQDYNCEDVLILDDLRDDAFNFVDLIKLLDNFVISSVKSRYKNKHFLGSKIIITTSKPIKDWYKTINEDRNQLFRRITLYTYCEKINNSCIAYCYTPNADELKQHSISGNSALDTKGVPITKNKVPCPIISLTARQVEEVENAWKSLGIAIDKEPELFESDDKNLPF